MGTLAKMGREGDTKIIWDVNNAYEVAVARRTFDDLRKKGYMAYSVKDNGKQNEQIRTFDPTAERVILVPAQVGG